jgi:hypothetical protein
LRFFRGAVRYGVCDVRAFVKATRILVIPVALAVFAFSDIARAERCASGLHSEETDEDCIERSIYFMPGAIGVVYAPAGAAGPFYGGGVQIAPYQWSHNNDRFGPSQGSVYFQAALLSSPRTPGTMALFEMGATASFERNSSRRWLIPYFGGTIGGVTHPELGTSSYAYPMGGIHLYWHHNIMIDAEGGYHFPFEDVDRGRGPRAQLSARFSLW